MLLRVIVEGSDCSGKSTVVERVKNYLRWDSKSLHHREGDQFSRYFREYAFHDKGIVFDRSHFSESIYSELWRGGNPFDKKQEEILDYMAQVNTIIIFSCPSLKTMRKRYNSRNYEQQINLDELEKSREMFIKRFENIPVLRYSSENYDELDLLVRKVSSDVDDL